MKLANAVEGGITGATVLTLLQEFVHKLDDQAPRPFLHKSGIIKHLKKSFDKENGKAGDLYIKLAAELLTNVATFGLMGLGKKKNIILRGSLLGAAAGLGSAFLQGGKKEKHKKKESYKHPFRENGVEIYKKPADNKESHTKNKILTVGLYTAGGALAGAVVKNLNTKGKKGKKNKTRDTLAKLLK